MFCLWSPKATREPLKPKRSMQFLHRLFCCKLVIYHIKIRASERSDKFMYETNLKSNQQKDINQDLIINQEELFSESSELQEYYGETIINIKQQKKEKERLERQIQTLEEVYLQLQDELLQISSDSEMCRELLKKSLYEGNYDDIEDFQQRIIDSEESNRIWETMREFYDDFMDSIQQIECDGLEW